METFQPCDLITIPNQRWEDERCCVPSTAHPQLKEMMCMNGRVLGWAASSPISPPPPLPSPPLHAHFLLGDRSALLSVRVSSATDPWGISLGGNLVLSLQRYIPLSSTWEGKQDLRMALILCHPFPYRLCFFSYAYFHFPSSLSSAQAINSVNWLTQSLVYWLRSLIKELLIGTLFNTGPCRGSCPLILSRQPPFPVCQSLNVINDVRWLSR